MKTKLSRLLALLLTVAMVLPMALPVFQVAATETVTELPTETVPVDTTTETGADPVFYQCNFTDETQLANFDLYQSGTSKFVVSDGVLMADGTDGEQKAILKQDGPVKSLSVNIIPGQSGVIYGGVYFGAKNAKSGQDQIQSQVILIKSDYSGWSDAANRIDIIHGQFNNDWKSFSTTISETGNGNNLFSGGNKEPLNLKLDFSEDVVLLTLSLVSNPGKYVQLVYEVAPEDMQGQVGLRSIGSDTCYDKLIVNEDYIPETLQSGLKLDGTDEKSYAKTLTTLNEKPVTIEAWVKMEKPADKRRQAIISNYTGGSLASNAQGTWGLYTDEDGDLWYTERCGGTTYNQTERVEMWTDEWIHVAVVRGQGKLTVYANGELVVEREKDIMGEATVLDNYLTIGYCTVAAGGESSNSTKGEIGDIRLWRTERTLEQIQDNMYRELTGKEEGLMQHWNFDSQEKGIVSNTVEGGIDLELLGHTQIGNEEIRRWDFSDETQLEDFTFYYAPDYKSESYNYAFSIKDEKLFISGSINNSSTDVKAILNEKIDNITYMGADVTQGGTSTASTSLLFGIKSVNSNAANDYEGYRVHLTRQRTSAAKRPYSEVWFDKISGGSVTAVTGTQTNTTFFPGADVKLPFHIQLTFTGNKADAFMYRLDDSTVTNGQTYTVPEGELDGQIGLRLTKTSVYFDNYTVISQIPVEETPEQDTTVYENEGYNFFNSGSKTWEMKQSIATPYTLEAWVKVPEGIANDTVGYIVGNPYRAPHISMQMATNGNLRLAWTIENADLTTSTTNYDVDTDLRNGRWTHVAYTCDVANDAVVAYINGKAVKTWTDAGLQDIVLPDHISPDNLFAVGSKKTNMYASSNLFPGWIADVRLWDHALSATEIQSSMMTQYTTAKDGLLFNAPLNEIVNNQFADLSGNGYYLTQSETGFQLETQEHEPGAYSMIVIPDQQILSHYYQPELMGMYQWIADNREKENIQIVMNVGDLADNCGNTAQWDNNKAAWELLPKDLPFITAAGNHDYDTNSGWNKGYGVREQLTIMNSYFPQSLFESYPTEIGFFDETNSVNQWQAFSVNGNKYLVMALEYVPQDDVIAWANQVAEDHPNHQIIMVTHSYVGSTGNLYQPKLWNNFLSKHENVIMAFSGHVSHNEVVHRTDKGENGNDVHNILMDAQSLDTSNRKYAMIGILRFNADGTLCDVSYYSTSRDQYEARSNFTLELPEHVKSDVAKVGETYYSSVTEAAANANGAIVEILTSTDEAISISSDVTIDLAGCSLSNVTVAEGATLTLIDSTATYEGVTGSATVTGNVSKLAEVDGKKYMVIGENGVYAAHRYYVGITHVSLDPAVTGFGYKAEFYGDAAVQTQIASIGYDLWLTEDRVVTRSMDKFQNVVTLRLKNFLVEQYGVTPVSAKATLTLVDGTILEGAVHSYSMRQMVELINEHHSAFTQAQLKAAALMIMQNETMLSWDVANILAGMKPEATVESVVVENQEMTVYGGNTATLTLAGASKFSVQDTADMLQGNPYADWIADYYVSMDAQAGEGLYLAGNYGSYGWIALSVEPGQTYTNVPVVASMLNTSVTYEEMVTLIGSFTCGIADTQNANTGATVTVELRLTDPGNPDNYIVIANTSVYFDPALTTDYQVVTGGITTEGQVITSSQAGTVVLHKTRNLANGTYFVEINTTDNTRPAGMVFAANDDASSYYLFRLGNGSKVELVKVVNGVETVVDTGYYPANRRKDVFSGLEIVVDGDTIHGYIHNPHYDRIHCFAVHTDDQMAGNRIGLWAANDGVMFQNSTVTGSTAIRKADVVIFGHSYTEMWTDYPTYFPEYTSIDNVGLGGSVAVQWEQFPEEIASYNPQLGIYLIGINDLTGGTTPKAVVSSMEKTLLGIKALVPEFEVVVTAVNHCPTRSTITAEISQTNALMRNLAASYDWIYYAETEYALCTDPSDPLSADSSLFSDGLHPNAAGYAILVEAIRSAAKGENQPVFDQELADAQLTEVKNAKMVYLGVYGQNAYTEENWVKAEPHYNAAIAKINACTTEMQVKNLDLSAEIAELDKIPNKGDNVIANVQDPDTSIQRSTLNWTGVDAHTVNVSGYTYSLDNTVTYKNPEGIFKLSNNSGAVGTGGILLNAHVGANKGVYGYLINMNTNGNYIQIYYVSNSYNNDSSVSATKYIGGIVLNNYGIRVEDTEFWFKIEGDKLYVNTVERLNRGEAAMLVVDLTYGGVYEVYESGYTGILAWAGTTSFDMQLKNFAAEEVVVEEEPAADLAKDIMGNLMDATTSDRRGTLNWTVVDDHIIHATGSTYSIDNTAVYSDSEFVFKLSNASAGIGVSGMVVRANTTGDKGLNGYLINVNTNADYIQIYYLNNSYNPNGATAETTYIDGVVLNNYGLTAADVEYYIHIEGSNMHINTLERHLAGTKALKTVDLTKKGHAVYPHGHTGLVSWVGNSVSFDMQLKDYTGTVVDSNMADETIANLMNPDTRIARSVDTWAKVDDNTLNLTGYSYAVDTTSTFSNAEMEFKLSNNTGHIGTGGLLLRASVAENNGVSGYLINYNINSNFIQIYYLNNYYNTDKSESTLTYIGGIVLNNYNIVNVDTEFYARIEGDKLYVNTVERQNAGTAAIITVDLTNKGAYEVYESGYAGLLSWVSDVNFNMTLSEFIPY